MKEHRILQLIKFAPSIFILTISFICTYFIYSYHIANLKTDKEETKRQFIKSEKLRVKSSVDTLYNYIKSTQIDSITKLQNSLKSQVLTAYNIIDTIYEDNKETNSEEEILELVKSALRNIRFNEGRGYFYLYKMSGINILHPIEPHLEGTSVLGFKDKKGTLVIKEIIDDVKKKDFFKEIYWVKPSDLEKEYKKIIFNKYYKKLNLFIGTGDYILDFNKQIKKTILHNIKKLKSINEYIFVVDIKGNVLVSNNGLEGKSLKELSKQNELRKEYEKFRESDKDSSFVRYKFKVPNSDLFEEKISYTKKIYKYGWAIGAGFNLDLINKKIEEKHLLLEKSYKETLNYIILASIVITLLFLYLSNFLSGIIERRFLVYKKKIIKRQKGKFENNLKELRTILDSLPMMIAYKDTNNNILTVNQTTANVMQKSINELSNIHMSELFPENYKRYYEYDLEVIKTKKPTLSLIEKEEINGTNIVAETSIVPIFDQHNNVSNVIVFMIDRTEKERLKKENKEKEKLIYQQSKLATMGEMISNIAHQWRQPLSTISTASTGIKMQKEMGLLKDSDLIHSMDAINGSVQYLSQTIEDFRNFFSPNKSTYSEFLISHTIDRTLKLVEAGFINQNIEIVKDIDEIEILSLENEIVQVLVNILNNAKDVLSEKTQDIKFVWIDAFIKHDYLCLEIKDNAGGINEDIIDRVFEPYFTTKHQSRGTGIGLYMSHEIATKLLKGNITVQNETFMYENKKYKGAKFILEIKI